MSKTLSEVSIIYTVAKLSASRIARKAIHDLQQMTVTMSGDDSGLKNTWDEICVQIQQEESFFWDAYDQTVYSIVDGHISELLEHEREAIWLQTETGIDWSCDEPEARNGYPVVDDDIVQYVTKEYVYPEADRWSNARIRQYIERSERSD